MVEKHDQQPVVGSRTDRWMLLAIPLLAATIVALTCYQFYQQQMSIARRDAIRLCEFRGHQIASQIEHAVVTWTSSADGLMHFVALNPEISNAEFEAYASRLLRQDAGLRSVGLVPDNIIRAVFPVEGNEDAVGTNLLDVPEQSPGVIAMMESRKPILAGPYHLLQGGHSFVYRMPVMLREKDDPADQLSRYWGQVALIVDYEFLMQELEATIPDDLMGCLYQEESVWGPQQLLFGDEKSRLDDWVEIPLGVPGVTWALHLKPEAGWPQRLPDHLFRWTAAAFLSLVAAFISWLLVRFHIQQARHVIQSQETQRVMELTQNRLQLALTHGNIGLWDSDLHTGTTAYSSTYRSLLREDDPSVWSNAQEDWESRLHPEDKTFTSQAFHDFLSGSDSHFQSEFRLRCGDGIYRWFRMDANLTRAEESEQRRVMGVLIDVTEDREARERLSDERLETQLILDSIPSLVILRDANSRILRVNDAVVKATGVPREQLTGKTVEDVIPGSGDIPVSGESGIVRSKDSRTSDVRLLGDRWVQTQNIPVRNSRGWTDRMIIVSTDITNLKQAELLQEQASRFQSKVGELALIGGWDLDCVTNKLTWSDIVKQIHEVPDDYQPDVSTAIEFYREDSRDHVQRVIDRAIADNKRWDIKLPLITAKGRQIYVRAMGQPIFENGRCVSIWGVFQDVTKMHQENELRESLFRNAPNAYLMFNEDGILECNPRAVKMLKAASREDLLSRHPAEFSPEFQLCGTASSEKCKLMDQLAHERGVYRFEWIHQRLDGEQFPCEVTLSHVETDSKPALLAAWRDLSEQKAAERERDHFFALSPDLFCVLDSKGRFKRVNSAWRQVKGPAPDALPGVLVTDLAVAEHREATEQMVEQLVSTGRVTEFRNMVDWHDGSQRYLEWNALAASYDKEVFFAVARDITLRIQSEQQLGRLNDDLQRSNQALRQSNVDLRQFAYVASHDLQTPLRGIAGFAQLLVEDYSAQLDETGNDFLRRISAGTQRMQRLIQDLLRYSKIEVQSEGDDDVKLPIVDLHQVIDDILTLMEPELKERNAKVNRQHLPKIHGDSGQLSQLFSNLIGNAIKYNSSEQPVVNISAADTQTSGSEWIQIDIHDNGIGIDLKFHDQIFEVFRRLHTEREYSGTGIGLAICKRVMQRHGGKLTLTSQPESGTCFHLKFPVHG